MVREPFIESVVLCMSMKRAIDFIHVPLSAIALDLIPLTTNYSYHPVNSDSQGFERIGGTLELCLDLDT